MYHVNAFVRNTVQRGMSLHTTKRLTSCYIFRFKYPGELLLLIKLFGESCASRSSSLDSSTDILRYTLTRVHRKMRDTIFTVDEVTIYRVGRMFINFMRRSFGVTASFEAKCL